MRWPDLTPSRPGLAGPVRRSAPAPALQPRVRGTVGPLEPCGAGPGVPALRRRPVQDAPGSRPPGPGVGFPCGAPAPAGPPERAGLVPERHGARPVRGTGRGSASRSNQSSGRPGPRGRRQGLRPTAPARCKGRSREVGRPVPGAPGPFRPTAPAPCKGQSRGEGWAGPRGAGVSALRRPLRARGEAGTLACPRAPGFPPYGTRSVQGTERADACGWVPAPACSSRGLGWLEPCDRSAPGTGAPLQAVIPPARIRRQEPLRWA